MGKANKKLVLCAFWIIIIFAVLSIVRLFLKYPYNFNIKSLNKTLEPITVNLESDKKLNPNDLIVCFDEYCASLQSDFFRNVYYYKYNHDNPNFFSKPIKSIRVGYKSKGVKPVFKKIIISNSGHGKYYNEKEISKFKNEEISFIPDGKDDISIKYSVKVLPDCNNYNGVLNHFSVWFLSLFSDWTIFIIPYIWLFAAYLLYIYYNDYFTFKFKNIRPVYYLIFFLALGLILRYTSLMNYPLWSDEIYTQVTVQNLGSIFKDTNHPSLFYLFEFIFTKLFSNTALTIRISALIFGMCSIYVIYIIFKDFSRKIALFAVFLASINTIFIYQSQEANSCILSILLSLVMIFVLGRYLKNPNTKNLVYYLIATLLMIHCSYYLIIFSFTNMLWCCADFIEKNKKDKLPPFIGFNILALSTLIPCFINNNLALSDALNIGIANLSLHYFSVIIQTFFLNKYVFIFLSIIVLLNLVLCNISKFSKNSKTKDLYAYLVYSMTSVLIIAVIISLLIKPITDKKTLFDLYGLLFAIEILTIVSPIEIISDNKIIKSAKALYFIFLLGIYFNITSPINQKINHSLQEIMTMIRIEAPYYHNLGYEIHGVISDYEKYIKAYPDIAKLDYINWHTTNSNSVNSKSNIERSNYTNSNNDIVVFISPIGHNIKINEFNPRIYVYHSTATQTIKYISKGVNND